MAIRFKSHKSPRKVLIIFLTFLTLTVGGSGFLYWKKDLVFSAKNKKGDKTQNSETPLSESKPFNTTLETKKGEPAEETQKVAEVKATTQNNETALKPAQTPAPTTPKPTPVTPAQVTPKTVVTAPTSPTTTNTPVNPPTSSGVYSLAAAQEYIEGEILKLVNAERARLGVAPLSFDSLLAQAADIRAREEAIPSFVGTDHTRPDGRSFGTVLSDVGYTDATAWGENLAWGYQSQFSYTQSQLSNIANKMFTGWKNSPGHYAQIKDPKYNRTGIGVVLLNQNNRTYWFGIQLFAKK